jgi:SAM-dependent methyltransferase
MQDTNQTATDEREAGRQDELAFWKSWMSDDGGKTLSPRAASWCDNSPNHELEGWVNVLIRSWIFQVNFREARPASILDVGSGPISMLSRSFFGGLRVDLKAADPLADDYAKIWPNDPKRMEAVCRPEAVAGEHLTGHFGDGVFDVVHVRNAIDHADHPAAVFGQLVDVVRPGGLIIVHGFENEAAWEKWQGFHQWNLIIRDGDLEVSGKGRAKHRLGATFSDKVMTLSARTDKLENGKNWCSFVTVRQS